MNGYSKAYGTSEGESSLSGSVSCSELRPFISDPVALSMADQQEIIFKYRYNSETVEFLAIEYRLTPSKLDTWFKEKNIEPADLDDPVQLEELEKSLENLKRISAVRLAGSILSHAAKAWDTIAKTDTVLLEIINKAVESHNGFDIVDPKSIATLTKAHTAMVKQQLDIQAMLKEGDGLDNLAGLLTKKLDNLFTEIDNLSVV